MAPVYREALGDSSVDVPRGVRLPVRAAARELQGFSALAAVERHVQDPGDRWHADVVTPAVEGDVEALHEDLDLSCHPDLRAG